MHPAHVPLESKSEASEVRGPRDLRPSGGLFSDHHHVWKSFVNALVHGSQKMNRVYIFLPTIAIRYPLTVTLSVIEIQHRRDRIDAKAVNMVLVEPEQG